MLEWVLLAGKGALFNFEVSFEREARRSVYADTVRTASIALSGV